MTSGAHPRAYRASRRAALVTVFAVPLAACGGGLTTPPRVLASATSSGLPASTSTAESGASASDGGCDTDALTPLCEHVLLTGTVAVQYAHAGSTRQPVKACTDTVVGVTSSSGKRGYGVPLGSRDPTGGHVVTVDVSVRSGAYRGAGTYTGAEVDTTSGVYVDQIQFRHGPATTASITVDPEGGGSFTFAALVAADGRTESGSLTWTCSL